MPETDFETNCNDVTGSCKIGGGPVVADNMLVVVPLVLTDMDPKTPAWHAMMTRTPGQQKCLNTN